MVLQFLSGWPLLRDRIGCMIPVLGLCLKIHQALQMLCEARQCDESNTQCDESFATDIDLSPPGSSMRKTTHKASPASTLSVESGSTSSAVTVALATAMVPESKKGTGLPEPFIVPSFQPKTEQNLNQKILVDTDRKYIVHTLSTVLMTFVQRPFLSACGTVAKALVNKYHFLRDDEGSGEHSWKWFIYYRCQNINRRQPDGKEPKRLKMDHSAHFVSTPDFVDDDVSQQCNIELLKKEIAKTKPKPDVPRELMRRTSTHRWDSYVNKGVPASLNEYISQYPLLKKPTYASLEFSIIAKKEHIRDEYEETFSQWIHAIVKYSRDTQVKMAALQLETSGYTEDTDDRQCAIMALRCLVLLFSSSKTIIKHLDADIPNILHVVPRGTPPGEATKSANNQPHIVWFRSDDGEELQQYFISVEQEMMMETTNISAAIFMCIAAHYIFNLAYHKKTTEVWSFVQERMIGLPSKVSKRPPSVLNHITGIARLFQAM